MLNKLLLIIFLIFCWFLFTFKITEVPPGINGDEAILGYNAALVAKTGYDSDKRFLPLFSGLSGLSDWKQPVTFYSEVLAFRLFGPSYFALRAVNVIFALIGGVIIFYLIRELLGLKAGVIGLLLYITTPVIIIHSHLALENIAPIPFVALWLLMLSKFSKKQDVKYLIIASASLGICIYSYLGSRVVIPILVISSLFYIYFMYQKKLTKEYIRTVLIFILVLAPFLIVLFWAKINYPGSLFGQYRPSKIETYQQLVLPYISSFDLSFLYIEGDTTPYHSTGKHGVFLLASLPLFIMGMIEIIKRRNPILIFILMIFFLIPLLYMLVPSIHRGSRLLSLVPPYLVISSLGFLSILEIKKKLFNSILTVVIILLIILNYGDFLQDYWYQYSNRVKSNFSRPIHKALEGLYNESKHNNLKPLIQSDLADQNQLAFNFFEQVYFPNKLPTWTREENIRDKSVLLLDLPDIISHHPTLRVVKIEDTGYILLINNAHQ